MKHLHCILLLLALAGGVAVSASASPGAHGPNGEHLDGPTSTSTGGTGGTVPRLETASELFELVGSLAGGELSVMIDRYDTNQPVLNGKLEVQYQDLKAQARFHADLGDYAFDDPGLLAALSKPGRHALLFTFVADGESDLLDATLVVAATAPHQHAGVGRWWSWWWLALALLALAAYALFHLLSRRARRGHRANPKLPRQESAS